MPNLIPDWLPWMRPAGRLIWAVGLFVIGLVIVFVLMRRPKPERPATWAECIAGAVGVVRDDDARLRGRSRTSGSRSPTATCSGAPPSSCSAAARTVFFPCQLAVQPRQDTASATSSSAVIYGVMFGLNTSRFAMWQKRGRVEKPGPRRAAEDARASAARCGARPRAGDGGRGAERG